MAEKKQKIVLDKKADSNLTIYEQKFQMLMKLINRQNDKKCKTL